MSSTITDLNEAHTNQNRSADHTRNTTTGESRINRIVRPLATAIMAAGFGFFGVSKIVAADVVTGSNSWDRLSETQWAGIGMLEVAAVISLLLALVPRFRKLGVAAATGLASLAACAVVFHIANSDPAGDIVPAVLQGLVAATYATLGARELRNR